MPPALSAFASASASSTLLLPPPFRPRPLSLDVRTLAISLRAHLSSTSPPPLIAVWHLPAHLALPLSHAARSLPCLLVWLNDRWSPAEAAAAAAATRPALLVLPDPAADKPQHPAPLPTSLANLPCLRLRRAQNGDILVSHAPRVPVSAPPRVSALLSSAPPARPFYALSPPPAIFFTSGTTSAPKPVLVSASSLQLQSLAKISVLPLSASTVYLHLTPLFHVGGASSAHAVSLANGTHVFPPPRLRLSHPPDARHLLRYAQRCVVDTLVAVPAVLQLLVDAAAEDVYPQVATVLYGAGRISEALRRRVRTVFPNVRLVGAYGMTETASSVTFLVHDDLPEQSPLHCSAGWPPEHVQVRIDPTAEGAELNTGEGNNRVVGEVLTRGPHVMEGYYGGEHVEIIEHGWFRTGDLGYVDNNSGALFLVGRRKDMIKSGGENVFAGEVEEALVSCTDVREAAVVGIPHRVLGEAVAAAVVMAAGVRRPEWEILKQLRDACRDCLSPFKRPKWIVKQNCLPRNATGKVLKDKVREQLQRQILVPRSKL